jgi:hypothetical protein
MADLTYSAKFEVELADMKRQVAEGKSQLDSLQDKLESGATVSKKTAEKMKDGFKATQEQIEKLHGEIDKLNKKIKETGDKSDKPLEKLLKAFGKLLPDSVRKAAAALKDVNDSIQGVDLKNLDAGVKSFGSGVVSAMKAGVKSALQFGVALNAATGGLLLIVGAVVGLVAVIAKTAKAQGEFNEKVNASKAAQDALAASVGATAREQESQNRTITETNKLQNAAAVIVKKIGDAIGGVIKPAIDAVRAAWEKFAGGVNNILKFLGLVTEEELKQAAAAVEFVDNYKKIKDLAADYEKQLLIIEKTETDVERKNQAKLSALNSYIAALAEQSVEMKGQDKILEGTLTGLKAERDALEAMIAPVKEREKAEISSQEKIAAARAAAEEKYKEAIARANAELATGELTEEDWATQREAAMKRWRDDLQGIVDEYNLTVGATVALLNETRKEVALAEQKKRAAEEKRKLDMEEEAEKARILSERMAAEAQLAKLEEAAQDALLSLYKDQADALLEIHGIEVQTLSVQQERERTALHLSEAYKKATDLEKAQMDAVLDVKQAYESQALAAKQAKEAAADAAAGAAKSAQESAAKFKEYAGKAASAVSEIGGAMISVASSLSEIQRAQIDEAIDVIDKALERELGVIDDLLNGQLDALSEMRNRALEEAGFISATSEEGLEAALQAAIETGDEALIYAERRRQEELAINREFDRKEQEARDEALAKEKAAKEQAEKEIAQLEYEAAMDSWRIQLAQAGVSIATAILMGFAQAGPWGGAAGAALMIPVGAAQIAAINANKPKPPEGAGGGGDSASPAVAGAGAQSSEPILPAQNTLAAAAANGAAQTGPAAASASAGHAEAREETTRAIYIDGVAAFLVSEINDGLTDRIDMRMVKQ